jgi:hypothetical protein
MIQCVRLARCVTQATDIQSECVIRIAFLCNNGCTKAPLCCVIRTLPVLLTVLHGRWSQAICFWTHLFQIKMSFLVSFHHALPRVTPNAPSSPIRPAFFHPSVHTYIYTRTWARKCFIKTVECGTVYEYTKYTNLQCKILKPFYKKYYKLSLYIKNSSTDWKECVCRYFLKVGLNFANSFLGIVTLGGKLLKILMPAYNALFLKQDNLAFGLWKLRLFLILILCIDEFVLDVFCLLVMNFINKNIYSDTSANEWPC